MATLPKANPPAYPDVYQIETTDPVIGGVPDPGTGAGMSNIPHKQLADRDDFLKVMLDGLVADAFRVSNSPRLLSQTGHFQFGPNGLIVQWARLNLAAGPNAVEFPRPFPNACFVVVPGDMASTASPGSAHALTVEGGSIAKTGFTIFARSPVDVTQFISTGASYFALGH